MHLASLEQQRELMRYMNSLNEWLGHDVEDRQAELRGVSDRIDRLYGDLSRLGLTRGPCKLYHHYMPYIANIHSLLTFNPAAMAWSTSGHAPQRYAFRILGAALPPSCPEPRRVMMGPICQSILSPYCAHFQHSPSFCT